MRGRAKRNFTLFEIGRPFGLRQVVDMKSLTVSNMSKRPFHNSELDDAGPQCCYNLAEEHHSLGNLEIMSEFQVVEKCVSLVHGDVAVCLE